MGRDRRWEEGGREILPDGRILALSMPLLYPLSAMKRDLYLSLVKKPARYMGKEVNAACKEWGGADVRVALVFPDLYEIGMSHLGLHILYHVLNGLDWALADRAYCPDTDLENLLRERGEPLWALESGRPLSQFDILGITIPYELCYTNILTILDLASVPFLSRDRDGGEWPLVIGGGSGAFNPEPVAEVFDAIVLGDGEEAVVEIAAMVREWKARGGARKELLEALAGTDGVYVPRYYEVSYGSGGRIAAVTPSGPAPASVRRRILPDLDSAPFPEKPLVPFVQTVHDRLGIEVARGCTRGCRFCQAGIIYRPVRERGPGRVMELAQRCLRATGWSELGLLSLSTGDYSQLHALIHGLMELCRPGHVALSLPSLRVGTLTKEIMAEILKVRKTGFTLAPEAGSERLRQVINKGITEEDLLETARDAFGAGWRNIKLYFMIGLPTETVEDVDAIKELAYKVLSQRPRGKRGQVTVSVGTFVPKPHTPFQWERQLSLEESRERFRRLRKGLRRDIRLKWHDPGLSFMEGVFSRGDRRLFRVIRDAWEMGARLDAWSDHFRPELFEAAAAQAGIDLSWYLREREMAEPLPWDHLDTGVEKAYLAKERQRSRSLEYTSDCRGGRCHRCGVCDFKQIRPVLFTDRAGPLAGQARPSRENGGGPWPCRFVFAKLNCARFISHLDTMRAFHRAAARAGLPVAFSRGFHPMPRFSFGDALPLGMESVCEKGEVHLESRIEPRQFLEAMNRELPEGLCVIEAGEPQEAGEAAASQRSYIALVPCVDTSVAAEALQSLGGEMSVTFRKSGSEGLVRLEEAVREAALRRREEVAGLLNGWDALEQEGELVEFSLSSSKARLPDGSQREVVPRPLDVLAALFGIGEVERTWIRIVRVA